MSRVFALRFLACRRGNIAVLAAIAAPALVGAAGLGVETGYWYLLQQRAQRAADVSAFAGAVALRDLRDAGAASAAVDAEAAALGYAPPGAAVATASPPLGGAHAGARAVEVTIGYTTPRYFTSLFSDEPIDRVARAVAEYDEPASACLLALDIAASGAMTFSGSANVSLISCEVMSNSIAGDAVLMAGSADLETECVNAVGGVAISGAGSDLDLTGCDEPRENLSRAPDPYEDVPMPPVDGPCDNLPKKAPASVTAGPTGVRRFCTGLDVKTDLSFGPGVYVVDGDFTINAGTKVSGAGVTFVMTGDSEIGFNGSAEIQLAAPTSGTYAGLAFMGDRDAPAGVVHKFNGAAASQITGAIYAAASDVQFLGNFSGADGCMQIVAARVAIQGSVEIETDCAGTGIEWADVPGMVRLVE